MPLKKRQSFMRFRSVPPIAAGIFFLIGIFLLQHSFLGRVAENGTFKLMAFVSQPLEKILNPFQSLLSMFQTKEGLIKESQELKEENRRLVERVLSLHDLKKENEFLRTAIKSPVVLQNLGVAKIASVLGTSSRKPKEIFFLNRGRLDDISIDDVVVIPERTLVGRISGVKERNSIMETLLSPNLKIAVKIGFQGVEGLFFSGSTPKVSLIPKDAGLWQGDLVLTSGQDGNFPQGLLIGKVAEVALRPAEPFQEATVELQFKASDLSNLIILKNPLR
jgi:rod shape-determining protein MreC